MARSCTSWRPWLERELSPGSSGRAPAREASATTVYRRAHSLPYRLALVHVLLWVAVALGASWLARTQMGFELDDAVLMFGTVAVISVGASLYQALWHREVIRPLLDHLTLEHRLPVRGIRTNRVEHKGACHSTSAKAWASVDELAPRPTKWHLERPRS